MILDEFVFSKIKEIEQNKRERPLAGFISTLAKSKRDFKEALLKGRLGLIAEIKRKSPSNGIISNNFNHRNIANIYEKHPFVKAISVLTDCPYFGGSLEILAEVKSITTKPVLRKDFIIDEYQIYESRFFGADAILLIARILSKEQINNFIEIAKRYNMDCLVEIHHETEIEKLPKNVEIIGINNRNLDTFNVDINTTIRISSLLKQTKMNKKILVTESGIHSLHDVRKIENHADAMLIGTALIGSSNIENKINTLLQPDIKICGITNYTDGEMAASLGADYLGFVFHKKSKRNIDVQTASQIIKKLCLINLKVKFVGVFVNESLTEVNRIQNKCNLDIIQLHGDEDNSYIKSINAPVIKAFRIKEDTDLRKIENIESDFVLLDTFVPNVQGGTGKRFEWSILDNFNLRKTFLAGGINPGNIKEASKYNPFALDISSGVEIFPGKKDPQKLKELFKELK